MGALVGATSAVVAPALAGILYPKLGLSGITLIDLTTFTVALITLLAVQIPQPYPSDTVQSQPETIWRTLTFGFRYIGSRHGLLAMAIALSLFAFMNQLGETIYEPMILARTNGNAQILGTVVAASGIGGIVGAIVLSSWGGFQRRVDGMLLGFVGIGITKIVFGIGQTPLVWLVAQFFSSVNTPLVFSSYTAVWYAKVAPESQRRVFAADHLIGLVIGASASLVAGPLADKVFEPAMQQEGYFASQLHSLLGTGAGTGIALLYVISAICILLVGIAGFLVPALRQAEEMLPDHDAT